MEYGNKGMTLDEAIEHALQKSKELANTPCGDEHKQLAEWLTELWDYRKKDRSK